VWMILLLCMPHILSRIAHGIPRASTLNRGTALRPLGRESYLPRWLLSCGGGIVRRLAWPVALNAACLLLKVERGLQLFPGILVKLLDDVGQLLHRRRRRCGDAEQCLSSGHACLGSGMATNAGSGSTGNWPPARGHK